MKANNFTYGLILLLVTLGLGSCTEIVDIELDSTYQSCEKRSSSAASQ